MSATSWLADLAPWALKGLHCSTGRSERRLGSTGTCSNTCRGIPFLYPARTFMRKDLPLRAGPQMVTSPSGIVPSRASSVHVSSSATLTIDERFSSSFSHLRTCPGEVWQPPTTLQLRYNSVTTPWCVCTLARGSKRLAGLVSALPKGSRLRCLLDGFLLPSRGHSITTRQTSIERARTTRRAELWTWKELIRVLGSAAVKLASLRAMTSRSLAGASSGASGGTSVTLRIPCTEVSAVSHTRLYTAYTALGAAADRMTSE